MFIAAPHKAIKRPFTHKFMFLFPLPHVKAPARAGLRQGKIKDDG
jgi:hypothetical protein